MGTIHPGMHGLLRITVTLQDELVSGVHLDLGYLQLWLMLALLLSTGVPRS